VAIYQNVPYAYRSLQTADDYACETTRTTDDGKTSVKSIAATSATSRPTAKAKH
jgi:hypothetical protein